MENRQQPFTPPQAHFSPLPLDRCPLIPMADDTVRQKIKKWKQKEKNLIADFNQHYDISFPLHERGPNYWSSSFKERKKRGDFRIRVIPTITVRRALRNGKVRTVHLTPQLPQVRWIPVQRPSAGKRVTVVSLERMRIGKAAIGNFRPLLTDQDLLPVRFAAPREKVECPLKPKKNV